MSGSATKNISKFVWGMAAVFVVVLLLGLGYKFGNALKHSEADSQSKLEVAEPSVPTVPSVPETLNGIPAPAAPDILRISDIDFSSYTRDIGKLVNLEIGENFTVTQSKMETYFVPGKGTSGTVDPNDRREGPAETSFSTFAADGGTVIVADRFNMADDAVKAEQMYAISKKQDDGTEVLVDFGMKLKCWRGEDPDAWGTDLCP